MMRLAGPVTHVGYVKFAYKGVVVETTGRGGRRVKMCNNKVQYKEANVVTTLRVVAMRQCSFPSSRQQAAWGDCPPYCRVMY